MNAERLGSYSMVFTVELVAFEIDDTITLFVTAADLTHGHLTGIVATARFLFARQKAFLGLVSHRNGIVTVEDLVTLPGSGRF